MKAYRIKVAVKNNLLLSAIEAAGFKSILQPENVQIMKKAGLTPDWVE
jgi:hypothetical protein